MHKVNISEPTDFYRNVTFSSFNAFKIKNNMINVGALIVKIQIGLCQIKDSMSEKS